MDDIKERIEASEVKIQFDHWQLFVAVGGDIWYSRDLGEGWVLYYQTSNEIHKFERIGKWIVMHGDDRTGYWRFNTQGGPFAYIEVINKPILDQMKAETWMNK